MSSLTLFQSSFKKINLSLFLFASLDFVNCSRENFSPPFKAKILKSTTSGYVIDVYDFTHMSSVSDKVDGDIGIVKADATLNLSAPTEVLSSSDPDGIFIKNGRDIILDIRKDGDTIIPENLESLMVLSLYANYEQVFDWAVKNLDLTLQDFGKVRLFFSPDFTAKEYDGTLTATIKINAMFVIGLRDFFFLRASKREKIPVAANLAVVAHEFGHGLLDVVFAKTEYPAYDTKLGKNETILNGINEGFADCVALAVTGRPNEFSESFNFDSRIVPVKWTYSTVDEASARGDCSGKAYCRASILASALWEISTKNIAMSTLVKNLYLALGDFRAEWDAHKSEESFDYHYLLKHFVTRSGATDKAAVCASLTKWFDIPLVKDQIGC